MDAGAKHCAANAKEKGVVRSSKNIKAYIVIL